MDYPLSRPEAESIVIHSNSKTFKVKGAWDGNTNAGSYNVEAFCSIVFSEARNVMG